MLLLYNDVVSDVSVVSDIKLSKLYTNINLLLIKKKGEKLPSKYSIYFVQLSITLTAHDGTLQFARYFG